jgi:hypothetical protein
VTPHKEGRQWSQERISGIEICRILAFFHEALVTSQTGIHFHFFAVSHACIISIFQATVQRVWVLLSGFAIISMLIASGYIVWSAGRE